MLHKVLSDGIAAIAVPLFFTMSGYLLFRNVDDYSLDMYIVKLRSRVRSLLIPYVIWNCFAMMLFWLAQTLLPSLMSSNATLIKDYSLYDFFMAFYDNGSGGPICYQFWFLRDLIILVVISPVIWYAIRFMGRWGIVFFTIVSFASCSPGIHFIDSVCFFSIGACCGIRKYDVPPFENWQLIALGILYLGALGGFLYTWNWTIRKLMIFIGLGLSIAIASMLVDKNRPVKLMLLNNSSFFIYAYHMLFLVLLVKVSVRMLNPLNDYSAVLLYFVCPTIIIIAGIGIYWALNKCFPQVAKILTGR